MVAFVCLIRKNRLFWECKNKLLFGVALFIQRLFEFNVNSIWNHYACKHIYAYHTNLVRLKACFFHPFSTQFERSVKTTTNNTKMHFFSMQLKIQKMWWIWHQAILIKQRKKNAKNNDRKIYFHFEHLQWKSKKKTKDAEEINKHCCFFFSYSVVSSFMCKKRLYFFLRSILLHCIFN